jgi:RNA polymerase sigma factor (sigma-70 family)
MRIGTRDGTPSIENSVVKLIHDMQNNISSIKDVSNADSPNNLLARLDQDPETARAKYEIIRQRTSGYFKSKGWNDADHLVTKTLTQFSEQLSKRSISDMDELLFQLIVVAKKVLKRHLKYWVKTPEAFNRLLAWLNPDANLAANKYREIHLKLTSLFISYGAANAEDLADETILRVIKKLPEIQPNYQGQPESYFSGVARKIRLEYSRFAQKHEELDDNYLRPIAVPMMDASDSSSDDSYHRCLRNCIAKLNPKDRDLILMYYEEDDYQRIDQRKELAQKLGISPVNLRVRKHRTMQTLEWCIKDCLGLHDSAVPSSRDSSKTD